MTDAASVTAEIEATLLRYQQLWDTQDYARLAKTPGRTKSRTTAGARSTATNASAPRGCARLNVQPSSRSRLGTQTRESRLLKYNL